MGYVPRVARQLRTDGHNVTLTNMGIPGAVLSPATQQLGNQYGLGIQANFMEEEGPFVPKDTTLVTIFAGGNDANTIGTAIDRGAATPAEADAYIDRQVASFASDYASLLAMVRGRANNPRIIVLNLPTSRACRSWRDALPGRSAGSSGCRSDSAPRVRTVWPHKVCSSSICSATHGPTRPPTTRAMDSILTIRATRTSRARS
jgi:hypothetical protein